MSSFQRHPKHPKISHRKRYDVDASLHGKVDTLLKDLRACAQSLTPFLTALEDEMLILDRLYYKGCNQHRSARFWRKVEEMRRFGKRLLELQLGELVAALRYSFYIGKGATRLPKLLKGSWVQAPEHDYVTFLHDRVQGSICLLEKAEERLQKAYESFVLVVQTGAFLQLLVTLTAIASRMNAIASEIRTIVETLRAALSSLSVVLKNAESVTNTEMLLQQDDVWYPSELQQRGTGSIIINSGTVSQQPVNDVTISAKQIQANEQHKTHHIQQPLMGENENITVSRSTIILETAVSSRPEQGTITSTPGSQSTDKTPSKPVDSTSKVKTDAPSASLKKKAKKKRPRDEIDDIFGAL